MCDTCIGQYECVKFRKIAYTCWIRHVVSMSKLVNTCNWNMYDKLLQDVVGDFCFDTIRSMIY